MYVCMYVGEIRFIISLFFQIFFCSCFSNFIDAIFRLRWFVLGLCMTLRRLQNTVAYCCCMLFQPSGFFGKRKHPLLTK